MTSLLLQAFVKLARVFRQTYDVHKPFAIFVAASMKCGSYFHKECSNKRKCTLKNSNITYKEASLAFELQLLLQCVDCRIFFPLFKIWEFHHLNNLCWNKTQQKLWHKSWKILTNANNNCRCRKERFSSCATMHTRDAREKAKSWLNMTMRRSAEMMLEWLIQKWNMRMNIKSESGAG